MLLAMFALLHAVPLRYEASASVTVASGELIGGYHGSFEVLTPQVSLAHDSGVFLDVAVPLARLQLGGREFFGPADLGAVLGWQRGGVRLGLATMWPTGNPHEGLGTGHVMLAPRLDARLAVDRVRLAVTAMLRGALPLGDHGLHRHQSIIAPHDLLDLMAAARLGVSPWPWLELWGLALPVLPLVKHPVLPVGARVALGAEVSVRLWLVHVTLQALVPVTQHRTSSWQVGASLGFGDSRPDASCH